MFFRIHLGVGEMGLIQKTRDYLTIRTGLRGEEMAFFSEATASGVSEEAMACPMRASILGMGVTGFLCNTEFFRL